MEGRERETMEPGEAQVKGVVIITLPPRDDPSMGKTVSFFAASDDSAQQFHENRQPGLAILQSPLNPQDLAQRNLIRRATKRVLIGLLSVSLFAFILLNSLSPQSPFKLRNSDEEDDRDDTSSFVLPLYPKLGSQGDRSTSDIELKLGRFVQKERNLEIGPYKANSFVYGSRTSEGDSSAITLPLKGNVFPFGRIHQNIAENFSYQLWRRGLFKDWSFDTSSSNLTTLWNNKPIRILSDQYNQVLIGKPARSYYLDIDTGSDLSWIQCDAPCTSCAKGPNSLYKPTRGKIVPSKDSMCLEIQRNLKGGYCDTCTQCDYEIEYADHSSSMGVLARDELNLRSSNGSLSKLNVVFGCAYDQQGSLLNSLAKTDGILGLSRSKVSLPAQLASSGIVRNVFGHCISPDIGGGGYMFIGDELVPYWNMAWIPMVLHLSANFYEAAVARVSYGGKKVSPGRLDYGTQRVVFDSGSSYTYFPKQAYANFVFLVDDILEGKLIRDTSDDTLPFCWRAESPIRSIDDVKHFFRPLTLQFGSKWWLLSTKFQIPPEGYLIANDKGNVCLGILDGSDVHDGSTIILGDVSLRGKLVVYDNENQKIGWADSKCKSPRRFKSLPVIAGLDLSI